MLSKNISAVLIAGGLGGISLGLIVKKLITPTYTEPLKSIFASQKINGGCRYLLTLDDKKLYPEEAVKEEIFLKPVFKNGPTILDQVWKDAWDNSAIRRACTDRYGKDLVLNWNTNKWVPVLNNFA